MPRIAINGYGRIGQCLLRAMTERADCQSLALVALNELSDIDTISYLTRYDTIHGRFPGKVSHHDQVLQVDDQAIQVLNIREPEDLPWDTLDIDLVLECSGSFRDRATAERHLQAGAKRLLLSHPAEADVDATIVHGINTEALNANQQVVSAASCTTNCIIPVLHLLDQALGIEHGVTTTIHAAMNDQPVSDAYHQNNLRLTRSAMASIIPVDTGLALGINRLLPHLENRFECLHLRVPTLNVSAMDLSICLKTDTNADTVNRLLREAAEGPLKGILGYTEDTHASIDFNHDAHSGVVDATQTRVSGQRLLKLLCWFDNEWGFANRMLDVALHWLKLSAEHSTAGINTRR
ncbi:erythrose-4-phosphate dehydrogenase [Terasakiispira papahanaumokuakeensis]|uniref:Erythrose-4-phosphate dehydrogenase n=1 Tax=Terasakiispira papahanaumokuakeensis TaxID=197479 RepID=A0A1E2VDV7_9GAMM|nr:glyceraldehyde 3-phosphate dehydrogenase NAD-binding domain-containing protein [Terasakiispira papahanaumokuakeensis]ODC05006.1 erythrose-4-phosphate dehydrogenase [Terasakiispira papahanaumokuakeensis]